MRHHRDTHELFRRIIATVVRTTRPMTVDDVAGALDAPVAVIAHCIGLHVYMERRQVMTIPPPADYWLPLATEVISHEMLEPERAGRMKAAEAALRAVLAETADASPTRH